ncbi:RluA family pseudouridine synthase [Breznakiellaceae bacterium SP9]
MLFENAAYIVIDKAQGLAVQGGAGVKISLDDLLTESFDPKPLLVHRLDKDTSGLMLLAKTPKTAAAISSLFESHQICKQYQALCLGRPPADEGCIRLDLAIRSEHKKSETRYRCLKTGTLAAISKDLCLLELELGTGRMHQIRRHLAALNCPVSGDDKYGDFQLNRLLKKEYGLKRLLLHSAHLVIPEGLAVPALDISAPLPEAFVPFLNLISDGADRHK